MMHIPGHVLALTAAEAHDVATVIFAHSQVVAKNGQRIHPRVLQLAADLASASGTTELPVEPLGETVSYEHINSAEAADLLGYTDRYVRNLAKQGRLPGVKRGNSWFFPREEVETFRDYRG